MYFLHQPKARPSAVIPSKYASLPCASPLCLLNSKIIFDVDDDLNCENVINGKDKAVLGIGISAVHDAVLRGVARIPGKLKKFILRVAYK